MNGLVDALVETYGRNYLGKIQKWVNEQYARQGSVEGQQLSLRDIDENLIVSEVQVMIDTFNLSLETVNTGIQVLPSLSKDRKQLRPVVFVNVHAVKRYYERAGLIIKDLMIAREGDKVEYSGSNKHIRYQLESDDDKRQMLCGFINFTVTGNGGENDVESSIIIDREELEASKKAAMDNVFGGVDMLTKEEWVAHGFCLLLKRILSEASSVVVLSRLNRNEVDRIKGLIALSEHYYGQGKGRTEDNEDVYRNDYGKVIGKMYQRFGVVDKLKHRGRESNVVELKESTKAVKNEPADKSNIRAKTASEKSVVSGFSKF